MFRTSGPPGEFKVVVYNEDETVMETLQPFPSISEAKHAIDHLSYLPFKAVVVPIDN